jgi:choline dehydrogenase
MPASAAIQFSTVSSCRMGPDPKQAVVDHRLRVRGLAGLRIVDASVFPTVTSGNATPPASWSRRGADLLREDAGSLAAPDQPQIP